MKDLYCIINEQGEYKTMCIFNYRKIQEGRVSSNFNLEDLQGVVFSAGNGLLIPTSEHNILIPVNSNFEEDSDNVYKVNSLYIKTSMCDDGSSLYCSGESVGPYHSHFSKHVNIPPDKTTFISEIYIRAKQVPFQLLKEKLMLL